MQIHATFLDEISWDIPHQTWGVKARAAVFRARKDRSTNYVDLIRCELGPCIPSPLVSVREAKPA